MYQVKAVNEIEVNLSQEKIYLMTPIIKNHTTGKKDIFRECFNRK